MLREGQEKSRRKSGSGQRWDSKLPFGADPPVQPGSSVKGFLKNTAGSSKERNLFLSIREFSLKPPEEMLGWKAKPVVGDLPQSALGSTVLEVLCLQDVWACGVRGQKYNTGWASPGFNFLL